MTDIPPIQSTYSVSAGMAAQMPKKSGKALKIFFVISLLFLVVSVIANVLLFFAMIALVGGMNAGNAHVDEEVLRDGDHHKVAVISAAGGVDEQMVEHVRRMCDALRADKSIVAVVVEVDSPGGGITSADEIHHMLTSLAAQYPLYVSMRSLAASGGYYISMPAKEIVAQPTSLVGSIGVIWPAFEMSRLLDKVGITPEIITSDEALYKDAGAPYRKFSETDRAYIKSLVNDAHQKFRDIVADGRKGKLKEPLEKVAIGRIWPAQKALDMGLIDSLGYLDDVCHKAAADAGFSGATFVRLHEKASLLQQLGVSARKPAIEFKLSPSLIYELQATKGEYRYAPGVGGE